MKLTFTKIVAALALATSSMYAAAAPITVVDTMTANLAISDTDSPTKFFTINLNDNGTAYVFGAGSVTSATLRLVLSDPLAGNEKYSIFLGSNPVALVSANNIVNTGTQAFDFVLDSIALADLSLDGKLDVFFKAALQGGNDNIANYVAVSSRLVANPVAEASDIPEPGSIGLMGLALAGLAAVRRRKQK
jgi:hypothetical protein